MNIKTFYNLGKKELFSLNRSITGKGTKQTLLIIKKYLPNLKIKFFDSGQKVFDWRIPYEWNIKDAYVKDCYGNKIIDYKKNNLHVISYSTPIKKNITKNKLLDNLHFLKKQTNAIPYITSYYKKRWGFCTSYNQFKDIKRNYKNNDTFNILINSSFKKNGKLNYGELVLKGKSRQEILVSTYICHPSMANNELSGPIVSMSLINYFKKKNLNKTIRFVFIPETIGSIAYISKNIDHLKKNVCGGFNLSCIGDDRNHSCMFSKFEDSASDEALVEAYNKLKINYKKYSFLHRGSDERQYSSPGVDLPITSIFRTMYGRYKEYHTSLDDFSLVTYSGIKGGFEVAKKAIEQLQNKIIPKNKIMCEPKLDKRNLYPTLGTKDHKIEPRKIMNFLMYSNGRYSIDKISRLTNIKLAECLKIYKRLKKENIIG